VRLTPRGLGRAYGELTTVPGERAAHLQSAGFEVYVLPTQGQQLSLTFPILVRAANTFTNLSSSGLSKLS
jgi:hypothetical protein